MKRATMFGIMKSTYSCYFDPSSLRLTKNSGDIYSAFHKTFDKRFPKFVLNFPKFATNLAISLYAYLSSKLWTWKWSCEFHAKFRWEVNKFIAREVRAILWNCLKISLDVWLRWFSVCTAAPSLKKNPLSFDSVRALEIHDMARTCLMNSMHIRDTQ